MISISRSAASSNSTRGSVLIIFFDIMILKCEMEVRDRHLHPHYHKQIFQQLQYPSMDKQFLDKRDRHAGISLIRNPELLFPYDSNGLCIYNLSGSNKVTAHFIKAQIFSPPPSSSRRYVQSAAVHSSVCSFSLQVPSEEAVQQSTP